MITLMPAPMSDQRFPCSFYDDQALRCKTRSSFRVWPTGVHSREEWPNVQCCSTHLSRVVRLAMARCMNHCRGVRVTDL